MGAASIQRHPGNNTVLAIDARSRAIVARGATGREPVLAHATPDGKTLLVVNRRDGTLGIHDAATLALRGDVSVVAQPEDVVVLPDSSLAFVLSRSERRISVVDLRRRVLVTNLELAGVPTDMLLKPDGGELYVISPRSCTACGPSTPPLTRSAITSVLGSAPTRERAERKMYQQCMCRIRRRGGLRRWIFSTGASCASPERGFPVPAGDARRSLRFDPEENLLLVVKCRLRATWRGDSACGPIFRLLTLIPVGDHPQELAVKLLLRCDWRCG